MRRIGDTGNKGILVGRIRPGEHVGKTDTLSAVAAPSGVQLRDPHRLQGQVCVRRPLAPAQLLRIRFNPRNPRLLASSRVRSITAIAVVAEIAMLRH